MTPSTNRPRTRVPESRIPIAIGVGLGLLAGAFLAFLWVVFAGAAAGNAGATSYFTNTFIPISLGIFGLYVVVALALFFARCNISALFIAWLPVILIFFALPALREIVRWFGAK